MRQHNRYQMPQGQYIQQQQAYQQQLEQQQRQQSQWAMQPQPGYSQLPPTNEAPQHMQRQISIEDAIEIARNQVPGQVVKAELESKGGQFIYEVNVVTNQGVKYEVKMNADSGEIIEVELD